MAVSPATTATIALYQQVKTLVPAATADNRAVIEAFGSLLDSLRRLAAELALRDAGV